MMYGLCRVKSCPDIVDQMNNNQDGLLPTNIHLELELDKANGKSKDSQQTLVLLRVASRSRRDSQTQRYSCGALDGKVLVASNNSKIKDSSSNPSPSPSGCGSRHNSNSSLNCNSFSVIEVS